MAVGVIVKNTQVFHNFDPLRPHKWPDVIYIVFQFRYFLLFERGAGITFNTAGAFATLQVAYKTDVREVVGVQGFIYRYHEAKLGDIGIA
jgi:hypothetical protein